MNKEEIMKISMTKALYLYLLNALQGKEFSELFYKRPDQKDIEKKAREVSAEVASVIIQEIGENKRGLSKEEFSEIVKNAVESYKRRPSNENSNSKKE